MFVNKDIAFQVTKNAKLDETLLAKLLAKEGVKVEKVAPSRKYGRRRPDAQRVRSESSPIIGSLTASKQRATNTARPAREPDKPSTWL